MTFANPSAQTHENRPASFDAGRPAGQGWMHMLIASSITILALSLLSHGWISMRSAIQKGSRSIGEPPGQVIQLAHMENPAELASPIAPLFTPEVLQWSEEITAWAALYDLDPNLVATVMQIESCGHPAVTSGAGAVGLFQVMPYHFSAGEDPAVPDINASRGLPYLKRSLELAGGTTGLALAGYNGGHGVITRPISDWPDETIRYAYWGSGIYADAVQNRSSSDRLDEWLQAGGASLCARSQAYLDTPAD